MKVGDLVHNYHIPRFRQTGVIIEHLEMILGGDGQAREHVFLVLYDNGKLSRVGSSFLEVIDGSG